MKNWIRHFSSILGQIKGKISFPTELDDFVNDFVSRCHDHHRINNGNVLKWIKQFDRHSNDLPKKILNNLLYFSSANLVSLTNEFVNDILNEFNSDGSDIYFVPIGKAGSGSQIVARAIRNHSRVRPGNVVDLLEIHVRRSEEVKNKKIVFFDDFSGTGKTINDWWLLNEPLILPWQAQTLIGIIVMNITAPERLKGLGIGLHSSRNLDETENIFSDRCNLFSLQEKTDILKLCEKTGCGEEYVRGFGNCGLMISFQHGCPNNSLPILWYNRKNWHGLFDRRNI